MPRALKPFSLPDEAKTALKRTLLAHEGRIRETAEALGIDRSHLWKKMKRYGLAPDA